MSTDHVTVNLRFPAVKEQMVQAVDSPFICAQQSEAAQNYQDRFTAFLSVELRKTKLVVRPVREAPPAPKRVDLDELARIEIDTRVLTRRLLDIGLNPDVAMSAAIRQMTDKELAPFTSDYARTMVARVTGYREAARKLGHDTSAANAGANLAVVDWLDDTK